MDCDAGFCAAFSSCSLRTMIEENQSENRLAKLEKQREIIRKKQKQKHAHEVMSLQARSGTAGNNHNDIQEDIAKQAKKYSKADSKPDWASYGMFLWSHLNSEQMYMFLMFVIVFRPTFVHRFLHIYEPRTNPILFHMVLSLN